jgi:MoaD family protein
VQILFFASIRGITGEKEIRWTTPAPILRDLLRELSGRYGPAFQCWVLEGEELGKSVLIQINGHDARHEGGLSAPLTPDDVIAIFPAIAGG